MKPLFPIIVLGFSLALGAANAGPMQDFETQLRASYGSYRTALFATNSGDAAKSAKALDGFGQSWGAIVASFATTPPPQYEADPEWTATLADIQAKIDTARSQIAAQDLPAAHLTLEAVRDGFGAMHDRNGLSSFSDRMNAYHAEMEHVLALDLAATDAVTLAKHAGVLGYLADKIVQHPAPESAGNADYDALQAPFLASVQAFDAAVKSGDAAAISAAVGGLKVPYSKFFLKFG